MDKLKPCPFCGGRFKISILDDEFNIKETEYENNPWSGLQYGVAHEVSENVDCPIATFENELLSVYGYDTREEAVEAINRRADIRL